MLKSNLFAAIFWLFSVSVALGASPFAGFYTGFVYTSISGNVTVAERQIGLAAFTINSDGVINSSSDMTGTVTDAGVITWNANTSGFATGKIQDGVISTTTSLNNNGTISTFRIEAKNSGPGIGEANDLAGRFTQINPKRSMRDLHRIRFVGDRFIAVGRAGLFATSFDGVNWTRVGVPTVLELYDVAYGNGRYVVVGDSSARFWSTNGVDWVANPAAGGPVAAVAFGNGKFVSLHFTGAVSTSPDGVAWTPGPSVPAGASYPGLDFVNGEFAALTGDRVSFSKDASEWTSKSGSTGVGNLGINLATHCKIAYGNGLYMVAGWPGLATSTDGKTWTKSLISAGAAFGNLATVAFGNGTFVVCDAADALWTSTNGTQWTRVDVIEFRSIAYGAGKFVGVGDTVWHSEDGGRWINSENDSFLPDLRESGAIDPYSESPVVGTFSESSTGTYSFGLNGSISWYKYQFAGGSGVAPTLTGETLRFAMNNTYGEAPVIVGNRGAVIVATDRQTVTFQLARPVTTANLTHGAKGDALVFVGSEGAIIWTTNVLRTNWVAAVSGTTSALRHVAFFPKDRTGATNVYIAVGDNGALVTSPNGMTWTRRDSAVNVTLVGSAFDNETKRFLVAGMDGTLLQSTNGLLWSVASPLPTPRPLYYFRNGDPYLGTYGIVGGGEHGLTLALMPTSTGLAPAVRFTMNPVSNIPRGQVTGLALGNGRFVAVGDKFSAISTDGQNWVGHTNAFTLQSVAYGKGRFVGVGLGRTVVTSGDGLRWQLRTNVAFSTQSFRSVTYGGGRFAAVGETGLVMVSEDGLTWVLKSGASASVQYNDVTSHNGTFVAGGTSGMVVVSSDGGNTWVEKPTFATEIKAVAWGNDRFVVAAQTGWTAVSTNGLTWERKQTPFISPVENRPDFSDVSFAGGTFYASSTRGEICTSTDGLNWKRNFTGVGREFRSSLVGNGAMVFLSRNEIYSLNVPDTGSPVIVNQPESTTVVEGNDWTLTSTALGTDLEFAWFKDGLPLVDGGRISGANSATLRIGGATAEDAGHYTFTVTNASGTRSSSEVSISVALKPQISQQPVGTTAVVGSKTVLSVSSPNQDASYAWFKNDAPIIGAGRSELVLDAVGLGDAGLYLVKVSNAAGTVQTAPVALNIISAPAGFSLDQNWPAQPIPFADLNLAMPQALALQPDGKILVGGYFKVANPAGGTFENMMRLNSDGTVDATFKPPVPDNTPANFYTLPNGKILLMGWFDKLGGVSTKGLARLNGDGTIDTPFTGGATAFNGPISIKPRPDGKLLVSGGFSQLGGAAVKFIGLLTADGVPDASFNSSAGVNNEISTFDLQSDGSIVVAGQFALPRSRLMRLTPSGAADVTFNVGGTAIDAVTPYGGPQISKVRIATDGKIYAGGFFGSYNGVARPSLIRLNANGTVDAAFNASLPGSGQSSISDLLESGSKILIAGSFKNIGGNTQYANLAFLDQTGAPTTGLSLATPPNALVQFLAPDAAGNVILAGAFTQIDGKSKFKFARLMSGSTTPLPLTIPVQPQPQTLEKGAPASFQVVATGHGSISFQWRKNGVPISGQTQATLRFPSAGLEEAGVYTVEIKDLNGSLISQPAALTVGNQTGGNPFADWAASFSLPAGLNGLNQDADGDGYSNAAEFAFGTNPTQSNSEPKLEQQTVTANGQPFPAVRYTRNRNAIGVAIHVRASVTVTFGTPAEVVEAGPAEDLGNGLERITVRATIPLPNVSTFFFEVRTASN